MVRLVEEEEFGPLRDREKTVPGVEAFFGKRRFVHACQFGEDAAALLFYIHEQLVEGSLQVGREERVLFRYIAVEGGRLFFLQSVEPADKNGLIGCQMGDIFKGAPFVGIDALSQVFFRQVPDDVCYCLVLVLKTGQYRGR